MAASAQIFTIADRALLDTLLEAVFVRFLPNLGFMDIGELKQEQELVRRSLAQGKSVQEIAELFGIPLKEVRRLAKDSPA